MVSFFSEVSQRYTERPCSKGEHTYNVRGDNYLVTTLERVEPFFFFFWGGGGGGKEGFGDQCLARPGGSRGRPSRYRYFR